MTDTLQTAELEQRLRIFQDYTASWGFPMNQDAHERGLEVAIKDIQALINSEVTKKLEAVLAVLPEKINKCGDNCQYGKNCKQVITHNSAIDKMTTAITNLVEGSRASSRINPSVRTTLNTEGKSVA